ncbi:2-succinyl-5-enolpyruvyl-6-hydroxy-3-cyclohexene-1-carboxylic-acid synthase, partial [Patescibacteria group bacterium]|nr:2-succinyl-5-enolpyruvyl-6-hydroxy-3-cyclohexene-1-carboxylic-acid synthase [Patescibacteria group bacterium]
MNLIQSSENINILWANLIIEELTRFGINYFCISPGSRSSPLTITTAKHPQVKTNLFYDERGAAFHALGYARASKIPAVLICTSGTAAANYYPAVIEASQEYIPLIVLSADRPPELRNSGANQTIDQVNLYGKYPRLFFDFPCPNEKDEASFVLSKIDMAVSYATGINPGPVHLNCMFREPLALQKEPWPQDYLNSLDNWPTTKDTFKKRVTVSQNLTKNDLLKVIKIIEENRGGIILAGRNENHDDRQAILKLADKLNWPVFADITSGLRFNSSEKVIHYFDQILLSDAIKERFYNVPIIHFGGQFVSKRLLQFLENHKAAHVHILETEKIIDPAKSVTLRI